MGTATQAAAQGAGRGEGGVSRSQSWTLVQGTHVPKERHARGYLTDAQTQNVPYLETGSLQK